jgi:hypothetical protein
MTFFLLDVARISHTARWLYRWPRSEIKAFSAGVIHFESTIPWDMNEWEKNMEYRFELTVKREEILRWLQFFSLQPAITHPTTSLVTTASVCLTTREERYKYFGESASSPWNLSMSRLEIIIKSIVIYIHRLPIARAQHCSTSCPATDNTFCCHIANSFTLAAQTDHSGPQYPLKPTLLSKM